MRHFVLLVFAVILTVQICFSQTQIINDSLLNPFFAKLYHIKDSTKKVRVLQIGDSHIQGDTLPKATSNLLQKEFGNAGYCPIKGYTSIKPCNEVDTIGIVYTRIGKNGATASDYLKRDSFFEQISSINPDIVIISLGTNDAAVYKINITDNNINLAKKVKKIFNDSVPILLTSPPYEIGGTTNMPNFIKDKVSLYVAELEEKISNMFAYLNLYNVSLLNYYKNNKIMSRDLVHYESDGYKIIGKYLATQLLNAYEKYQPPKVEVLSTESSSSSSFENIISSSSSEITQSSSSNYTPPVYTLKPHCNKPYYTRKYAGFKNKDKCLEMVQ